MLPKENRLKKQKDFERVFKTGKGLKEDFLFFRWVSNNLKISRFAFIVSLKISKKATVRNKIKRKLREVVRLKLPKIKKGIDGVFIAGLGIENKDFWQIENIVERIFKKAKLYKNEERKITT